MFLDINCSNFILIAPNEYRKDLIKDLRSKIECSFKIYSKEELLSNYYGKYDINSLIFVMNKSNVSYENAKMLLENINICNKANNQKTLDLYNLKNELISNNLLRKNEYLTHEFSNKNVYIFGYGNNDVEISEVLNKFHANYQYIDFKDGEYIPEIYEFNTTNEEVFFVFNKICDLLKSGIKQDDIVIVCDDSYSAVINKMCKQFNLPNLMPTKTNYAHKPNVLNVIKQIEQTGINDFLRFNEFSDDETINEIKGMIESFNLTNIYDEQKQIATLKSLLNSMIVTENVNQFLEVKESLGLTNNDKHYFLFGFNQSHYPFIKKDDDYLTNKEKVLVNRLTSFEQNSVTKKKIVFEISNTKNLTLSYSLVKNNAIEYPSSLINEFKYKVHKNNYSANIYSKKEAEKTLAKLEDLNRKFNFDSDLRHSYLSIADIPYISYEHKFTKLENYEAKSSKRIYSYSGIKDYFVCPFKYYLTHVLCIDDFEDTFNTKIGSLFHKVLENIYDDNYDYNKEYNEAIKDYAFTKRELVLLERMKEEFVYFVKMFKTRKSQMNFKYALKEQTYFKDLSDLVSIKGKIDSVVVTTDGKNDYYSIIDYKTGSESFERKEVPYGFSMQLPTYASLLKDQNEFEDKQLIGYYIQPICNRDIKIPTSYQEDFIRSKYKLSGGFIIDLEKMRTFVTDFSNVKNLNEKIKEGKSGVNTKTDFEETIKIVEQNFLDADRNIQEGNFDIRPAKINNESKCEYCPFEDICNKDYKDFKEINLKGDE